MDSGQLAQNRTACSTRAPLVALFAREFLDRLNAPVNECIGDFTPIEMERASRGPYLQQFIPTGILDAEAFYQAPLQVPLPFAENSVTDIPQVDGSCLKPSR